jgi:wobble nucleotide-excising tRNase
MLRKILKIKNVGRFEDCKWRCGSQFESMSLIYGENGRGKSTFCDILRSCQTSSPDHILGRKRLGATGDCEVELRTDSANHAFSSRTWNLPLSSLAIFDTNFVHQNIYAGDKVDHDHKRNLYRVVVGDKGVTLAKKVDDLDVSIREAGKEAAAKRAVLEAKLLKGTDLKAFINLKKDEDIRSKIEAASNELKNVEAAQKQATLIQTKRDLQKISTPESLELIGGLLAENLPAIAADAEKNLRAHLASHTNQAAESWVSQGLDYQKGDSCPYCGQNTSGSDLIGAYRAYFDKSYVNLKGKLTAAENDVSSKFSDKVSLAVQKITAENAALREFWRQFQIGKDVELPDTSSFAAVITDVRDSATSLIKAKMNNPLEAVEISPELNNALKKLLEIRQVFEDYNEIIRKLNSEVAAFKAKQSGTDITKLKAILASLNLIELRFAPDVAKHVDEYVAAEAKKGSLDTQKTEAKAELDNYDSTVLAKHEKRINELLAMFGAGFSMVETERSDVGGKPSFSYKLRINNVAVDIGNDKTPISSPSFRNTLSAGDKSTLALALFISQVEANPQAKDKIVVFDDPFTSQDRSRRTATQSIICNLAKQVRQVFVLSHDPYFLRSLWDGYKGGGNVKTFQFSRMANNTTIGEWDIQRETAGEYAKKHRVLWDYFHNSVGDPRTVAQTIRPVLEEYLRLKLPQSFLDTEWLGNFIEKIRNAPDTDPMAAAKAILSKVELINDYSKRYHHNSNPSAATEIVDENELANFTEKTLEVVGGF